MVTRDRKAGELRKKILAEIDKLELLQTDTSKEAYRSLHAPAVRIEIERSQDWIQNHYPTLTKYLANGNEIKPDEINLS